MDYTTDNPEFDTALEKHVLTLSPEIQKILKSNWLERFAHELGVKCALTEDEEEAVMHETALVLMQAIPVEDYFQNLIAEALLPPEIAEVVYSEVSRKLLTPLKSRLRTREEEKNVQAPPPAEPTPVVVPQKNMPPVERAFVATEPPRKASYSMLLDTPHYDTPPDKKEIAPKAIQNTPAYTQPIGRPLPRSGIPPLRPPTPPHAE